MLGIVPTDQYAAMNRLIGMLPKSHDEKNSLKEKGTIRNLPVVDSQGIEAAGLRISKSQMRID